MRPPAESASRRRPGASPLQEQHRFRRAQLRMPRQLSAGAIGSVGTRSSPGVVPFLITRQIFAGAGKLGIEAEGFRRAAGSLSDLAARGFLQRAREHRHDESPAVGEYARRTACGDRSLSSISRHHWRRQHERVGHGDENRHDRAGSQLDRARNRSAARHRSADRNAQGDQSGSESRLDHGTQ